MKKWRITLIALHCRSHFLTENPILRDYTLNCLLTMPRHELEEFSLRILHRMVPEETMSELFTFDQEELTSDERAQSAKFDAMLRMTGIALGEVVLAFSDSDNATQNTLRMSRLLLWHFYAISFNLEEAITLEQHCEKVELILTNAPQDAFGWVKELTELLHFYAELNANK